MKKSTYRTMAEALQFGGLKDVKLSTGRVDARRLSVDEIKEHVRKQFTEAKKKKKDVDENVIAVLQPEKGWGDDDLAKQIDWIKQLDLKEAVELTAPAIKKEDK